MNADQRSRLRALCDGLLGEEERWRAEDAGTSPQYIHDVEFIADRLHTEGDYTVATEAIRLARPLLDALDAAEAWATTAWRERDEWCESTHTARVERDAACDEVERLRRDLAVAQRIAAENETRATTAERERDEAREEVERSRALSNAALEARDVANARAERAVARAETAERERDEARATLSAYLRNNDPVLCRAREILGVGDGEGLLDGAARVMGEMRETRKILGAAWLPDQPLTAAAQRLSDARDGAVETAARWKAKAASQSAEIHALHRDLAAARREAEHWEREAGDLRTRADLAEIDAEDAERALAGLRAALGTTDAGPRDADGREVDDVGHGALHPAQRGGV